MFFQVRKAAQQGVCAILRGSDFLFTDTAPAHHPAAVSTAKFCIKEMERAGGEATCPRLLYLSRFSAVRQTEACFFAASLRQQRGHHHASRAGPPQGADGNISPGSRQIMLRDSAASDDAEPRGESINIQ